jgi:hypothetical protein
MNELWQKHPKDPISVRTRVLENLDSIFNYSQHALLDLNWPIENDTLFMLIIQIEIMEKCGHHNSISFNASFNMNQIHYMKCIRNFIVWNIIPNVCNAYFAIFLIHHGEVWWIAKWNANCIYCHWKKSKELSQLNSPITSQHLPNHRMHNDIIINNDQVEINI